MFAMQTKMTGVAERSFANEKPIAGMSSPGGEDTGEGELNINPISTVDLGLEPLIWVENTLLKHPLSVQRHFICPITTQNLNRANQNQTETNQKMN
ncbi:MAG TPA: hypothetical protein VMH87_15880 [Pseudomonadales bacterium]|nr:hypothetical protein [Pseudomonadales bacterium]